MERCKQHGSRGGGGNKKAHPKRDEQRLGFDWALLEDGWARDVVLRVSEEGLITEISTGVATGLRNGANWTAASGLPGMTNVHSHAHQRLMVGLAERSGPGEDSFWTWREVMYEFAGSLDPEQLEAVAAQAYLEMLEAGFTAVGEFQYLHNQPDGSAYEQSAELSLRCLQAAGTTGIAITLLPVLYQRGGFDGRELRGVQRRFSASSDRLLEMVETIAGVMQSQSDRSSRQRVGIAPHSLRAVALEEVVEAVSAIRKMNRLAPIHVHVAEQLAEIEECQRHTGRRPVEWLLDQMAGAGLPVDGSWCLIHATHLSDTECAGISQSDAVVGLCPTTEANLGDGTFRAREFLSSSPGDPQEQGEPGGVSSLLDHFAIGTDSQVRISVAEELRQLETSQRLRHGMRNVLSPGPDESTGRALYAGCARGGATALNQPTGSLAVGQRADLVVLDPSHSRLVERTQDELVDSWIFAGDNSCVRDVYVGGQRLVENGRHVRAEEVGRRFRAAVRQLCQRSKGSSARAGTAVKERDA